MLVAGTAAEVTPLAELAEVAWIENFTFREKHNEYGAGVISGTAAANARGYDGSNQTVAVADTGLGDGTQAGAHTDIPSSRITAINDWPGVEHPELRHRSPPDGAQDVDSGHGTHTALRRSATATAPGWARAAPPAPTWCSSRSRTSPPCPGRAASGRGYFLLGLPDPLYDLFDEAYADGARIHSNSWGSDVNGDYTARLGQRRRLHVGLPADAGHLLGGQRRRPTPTPTGWSTTTPSARRAPPRTCSPSAPRRTPGRGTTCAEAADQDGHLHRHPERHLHLRRRPGRPTSRRRRSPPTARRATSSRWRRSRRGAPPTTAGSSRTWSPRAPGSCPATRTCTSSTTTRRPTRRTGCPSTTGGGCRTTSTTSTWAAPRCRTPSPPAPPPWCATTTPPSATRPPPRRW